MEILGICKIKGSELPRWKRQVIILLHFLPTQERRQVRESNNMEDRVNKSNIFIDVLSYLWLLVINFNCADQN